MSKKKPQEYETVKLKKQIVDKARANKKKNGTPVSVFFEKAANAELLKIALAEHRSANGLGMPVK